MNGGGLVASAALDRKPRDNIRTATMCRDKKTKLTLSVFSLSQPVPPPLRLQLVVLYGDLQGRHGDGRGVDPAAGVAAILGHICVDKS